MLRADTRRGTLRKEIASRFPTLSSHSSVDRTAIVLGRNQHGNALSIPLKARLEHAQVIGTTGGGKTKFLEHCIRQDIASGRGVCVIDPHGNHPDSLYGSLLAWLDARGFTKTRTIHLIDPNAGTHVTGLDPLALPSPDYDFSVIAEAMQEALERVWGEEDMNAKPTMQRVLSAILAALTELKLTLAEARLLFDPQDKNGIRAWAIENLPDSEAREELEWLDRIATGQRGEQDFRMEVTGPRNRLAKLTRNTSVRAMVGQQNRTIDFRAALDEGHIILANLSPGPRASDKATQLLGRLITRMLFFHCERRKHPERPFFFYLDECQLFLSGDVSRLLAESRKWGMGVVLASQYLAQFELAGLDVLEAVKNATNLKAVFRMKDAEEAAALADLVFPYDLEMPVEALIKPNVVGQRITRLKGESVSEQTATSETRSETRARSYSESYGYSEATGETVGETVGATDSEGVSSSDGVSMTESSSESAGLTNTDSMTPSIDFLRPPTLVGISQAQSAQVSSALSSGHSSSRGSNSSHSKSVSSSRSTSSSVSNSESVSRGTSFATSVARGVTRATAHSNGTQEAFESIYENRPGAVHGLENIRYMAARTLRNLTAGRAAVSFVDTDGLKTAALTVANVESYALPAADFERLRRRVFDASPSATPTQTALDNLTERQAGIIARALLSRLVPEPESAGQFRNAKRRPEKASSKR